MAKTAIEILKADHRDAKNLFQQVIEKEEQRAELFDQLAGALEAHVTVEKEVFYPRIVEALGDKVHQEVINDQETEETDGTDLLENLVEIGVEDPDFLTKFQEFRDIVLKHAVEVEEGKLFPIVEREMERTDLEALGKQMEQRKQELTRQIEAKAQ